MMLYVLLFFSLLSTFFVNAVVVSSNERAESYLRRYGFLPQIKVRNRRSAASLTDGIKRYQSFYHLNITGYLDDATVAQMTERRCGNTDLEWTSYTSFDNTSFTFLSDSISPRLTEKNLKWKITEYPYSHSEEDIDEAAKRAMKMWSNVCKLNFTQVWYSEPDIVLKFQYPFWHDVQCNYPFRPDTLAHYVPGSIHPKKTHFNERFSWKTDEHDNSSAEYLVPVIAHEIGHALGIAHSGDKNSIMYSYAVNGVNELSIDDIAACVERYGSRYSSSDPDSGAPVDKCPSNVTRFDGYGNHICAIIYTESYCAGEKAAVTNSTNETDLEDDLTYGGISWNNEISSLEVNPNCVLKVCTLRYYEGSCKIYEGGLTGLNIQLLKSYDNSISSLTCYCS